MARLCRAGKRKSFMTMLNNIMMVFGTVFCLFALPFVVEHVQENWDADEYPHSGFCPDCPAWSGDNTLPPVQEYTERGGAR